MTKRDQDLIAIRPILELDNSLSNEEERFQNEVLRPLLKLQNPLLKLLFLEWAQAHKQKIGDMATEKRKELVEHVMKTNKGLRAQLFGIILGMMTEEELEIYIPKKREYNRRMTSMLIMRLQDQLLS